MAQRDFTAPVKSISQRAIVDIRDFIKYLHKIIKERGYHAPMEQSHKEHTDDQGNQTISFYWYAKKKVSNYVKLVMEIQFSANVKNVSIEKDGKKKVLQDGNLSLELGGYIEKDYEDEWTVRKESSLRKVLRELYDKFLDRDRMANAENTLVEDINLIINEIKAYVKMHRLD
jgi:outer membrane receptor for ferrienterochelin and colicin